MFLGHETDKEKALLDFHTWDNHKPCGHASKFFAPHLCVDIRVDLSNPHNHFYIDIRIPPFINLILERSPLTLSPLCLI